MPQHTQRITISTSKPEEVIDISDIVAERIPPNACSVTVCVLHTTCAITTADLDPGTDLDMLDAFRAMVPDLLYRHPHNPSHVGDHILAALIGPSITLPCENGSLVLGTWQRVVLFEFDGPRERTVTITSLP